MDVCKRNVLTIIGLLFIFTQAAWASSNIKYCDKFFEKEVIQDSTYGYGDIDFEIISTDINFYKAIYNIEVYVSDDNDEWVDERTYTAHYVIGHYKGKNCKVYVKRIKEI